MPNLSIHPYGQCFAVVEGRTFVAFAFNQQFADDLVERLKAHPSDRWSDLIPSIRALYHHWRQAIRRHGRAGVVLERLADAPEGEASDIVRLTRLK
ncbi:MAG: hypothetical protein O7G88_20840 [bacterium]|nr:hypothetical protein [bacterium]